MHNKFKTTREISILELFVSDKLSYIEIYYANNNKYISFLYTLFFHTKYAIIQNDTKILFIFDKFRYI